MRRRLSWLLAATIIAGFLWYTIGPAAAATRPHIIWGANVTTYPKFRARIPGAHAVRIYYGSPATAPAACPRQPDHAWETISVRPDYAGLMAGRYDHYYRAWFKSCPPHTDVTAWHEASGNNPLGYPKSIHNAAHYKAILYRLQGLARHSNVRIGTLLCGPLNQVTNWLPRHLGWYGFDLYFNTKSYVHGHAVIAAPFATSSGSVSRQLVWHRLDANLAAIRHASGQHYPRIDIGESNASPDWRRTAWFTDVASWFGSHDGHRMARVLTFWRKKAPGTGGLSGPWPPSAAVIRTLRHLAGGSA
jgi:hypothetical protein